MRDEEKKSIFDFMDLVFSHFITRLHDDFGLKEEDLLLLSFLRLKFGVADLVFLFDYMNENSLFKKKQRLKKKLGVPDGQTLDDFLAAF